MSGRAHLSVAKEGLYWVPYKLVLLLFSWLGWELQKGADIPYCFMNKSSLQPLVSGKDSVPHGAEVSIYADLQGFFKKK